MALKNSQYYAIMREYEQIRLKNHDLQKARYEEVYEKLPEFKSLDESISVLSVQYGKKTFKRRCYRSFLAERGTGDPQKQQETPSGLRRFPGRLSRTGL